MQDVHKALMTLQDLDREISAAAGKVASFEPMLDEVEAPLIALQTELNSVRKNLDALNTEARRLERAADEKRQRLTRYEERLMRVRDAREEAAARTELDLVSRALDADEEEALQKIDLARRSELKADELARKVEEAEQQLEPRRRELLEQKNAAERELNDLLTQRQGQTSKLDEPVRQLYERVRAGRSRTVLAALTADGACGNCFSIVPLQRQTEIQSAGALVRCEHCGVILYPEDSR